MRALVTGAGGFIGAHVVRRLLQEDDIEVVAVVRRPSSRLDLLDRHFSVMHQNLALDSTPLPAADWIISLAATAEPSDCFRDPLGAYSNNARLMVNTLASCAGRVIHVSTNEVFGPGCTDLPHRPHGPYAGAKAVQEMVCVASAVPTTIVNTQNLFGPWQQPNKFIPTAIRSLQAHRPVRIQSANGQPATRPFLHARSLADGLLHLIRTETTKDRVNIAAGQNVPLTMVVERLAAVLSTPAEIEFVEAGDRSGHELNGAALIPNVPGWAPTSLNSDLDRTAQWYREHPEWLIA